jgi:SAM-dependent methyltransferase
MTVDSARMTRKQAFDFFRDWLIDGGPVEEMDGYLRAAIGRYLHCARELATLPQGARVLEIGANPYWFPLLMTQARPDLRWTCTNGGEEHDPSHPKHVGHIVHRTSGERVAFDYYFNNVETEPLPFAAGSFDAVVFCEVFEHLYQDPVASLEHIRAVLAEGGLLLLTTPNPGRAYNVQRVLFRQSIYDPFSGYGTYGRHNREYSGRELRDLFEHTGYDVVALRTIETSNEWLFRKVLAKMGFGEHHLILGRKLPGTFPRYRPRWLYRSYPDDFHSQKPAAESTASA